MFCVRNSELSAHHVAKRLGLKPRMVRYLAQTGVLKATKSGIKIWKFDPADVEDLRLRREAERV
jgi:DNA-binding transcriptional MerR regulator